MPDNAKEQARLLEQEREQSEMLREELAAARMVMAYEDAGWKLLTGSNVSDVEGPALDQLKDASVKIREVASTSPITKRGLSLRHSYVWSKPPQIPGFNVDVPENGRGRPTRSRQFFTSSVNQNSLFSDAAHLQMEFALGTDGCYILVGDDSTKEVRPIPLSEIHDVMTHPEFPGEIWAYLRRWKNNGDEQERWFYTDQYTGRKQKTISRDKRPIPVAQGQTILDVWANKQSGWAFGLPDALPAIPWVRMYTELMDKGRVMTEALALFAAKVTVKSKNGSANVGVKVGQNRGTGNIATLGEGNNLDVFQSAGKTYDFNGIRPVAAMVATALEVSIVHLLSDPGAAGSSYGSASNLDLPTKRAMVARQNMWAGFLSRVIKWATNADVEVAFPDLDDADVYRRSQVVALAWQQGLFHPQEAREAFVKFADMVELEASAPADVLIPNNAKSLARRDIDTDAASQPGDGGNTTAASPDQGRSSGNGGAGSTLANDERTDQVSELLGRMRNDEFLGELRSLVERLEAAKQ